MSCTTCEAPDRSLWPANRGIRLGFADLPHIGYWTQPLECPECGSIWIRVSHEPFSSFAYDVLWPYTIDDWIQIHSDGQGETILQWHNATVEELGSAILEGSDKDADAIRSHDSRLGQHGPFISGQRPMPDLEKFIYDT